MLEEGLCVMFGIVLGEDLGVRCSTKVGIYQHIYAVWYEMESSVLNTMLSLYLEPKLSKQYLTIWNSDGCEEGLFS